MKLKLLQVIKQSQSFSNPEHLYHDSSDRQFKTKGGNELGKAASRSRNPFRQ